MYTNSRLDTPEYMRIHINDIPEEVRDEYNTDEYISDDGYVYCEINGALYGLAQAGFIANRDLTKHLKPYGYYPSQQTSGLWLHKKRPIVFTLVVDDFACKYESKDDINHLFDAITDGYPLKIDWEGKKYLGIDLEWHYDKKHVITSMKGYVKKALKQFLHVKPSKPVHGPTKFEKPEYGKKVQYAPEETTKPINEKLKRKIQQVAGKFLYSGRAVDNTTQHAINDLCIAAATATDETQEALDILMDYLATHPDAKVIFRASDMQLLIDSDASYLTAPKARSRAGGYHYLGNYDGDLFNGPIYILAKIIKAVMSSAAEAECGALYINAQDAIPFITKLEELGHKQKAVPMKTDNSTANGIMNKLIKRKRSNAFDMRFHWLIDRVEQGQFNIYWAPGSISLADYFTKQHSPSHHQKLRPIYLYEEGKSPNSLLGCIEILKRANNKNNAHGEIDSLNSNKRAGQPTGRQPYSNIIKLNQIYL